MLPGRSRGHVSTNVCSRSSRCLFFPNVFISECLSAQYDRIRACLLPNMYLDPTIHVGSSQRRSPIHLPEAVFLYTTPEPLNVGTDRAKFAFSRTLTLALGAGLTSSDTEPSCGPQNLSL